MSDMSAFEKYGEPAFVVLTTAVVLAIAWWLWTYGSETGQGAALTLAGGAATHLLKEAHEILRFWFAHPNRNPPLGRAKALRLTPRLRRQFTPGPAARPSPMSTFPEPRPGSPASTSPAPAVQPRP